MDFNPKYFCDMAQAFGSFMSKLNKWLSTRTFMIAYDFTLVDFVLTFHLLNYFRFYLDKKLREEYCHVTRYFDFMVH